MMLSPATILILLRICLLAFPPGSLAWPAAADFDLERLILSNTLETKDDVTDPLYESLRERETLCSDPSWEPTVENWVDEGVDDKLSAWWNEAQGNGTRTFVDLISSSFGDMSRGQECGIGKTNCFVPDCQPFKDRSGPRWVYFVRYAVVQMHTLFNNIYDASNTAEGDFTALITDITDKFFHWDVQVDLKAAQPWITAGVTAVLEFIPISGLVRIAPSLLKALIPDLVDSAKAFGLAGTQLIGGSGTEKIEKQLATMQELGEFIKQATQDLRNNTDKWATTLFNGDADATGKSIIDYLRGGRFTLSFMSASEMSDFMFQLRVAWLLNRQWIDSAKDHSKKFVMCTNSTDVPCDDETRYSDGNRTCCTYQITGKATYENNTDFATLKGPSYKFNVSQITESSVRSYLAKGFDMGERNASDIITNSLAADDTQFFSRGIGAEGIFTLPVCDVGADASWVAKWTANPPMLPCCCGPHCWETLDFYKASSIYSTREDKDWKFKQKFDKRCVAQYPAYLADWSRAASLKVPVSVLWSMGLIAVAYAWLL